MRLMIGIIVICGLAFWLFTPHLSPVQPDPRLRTFSQAKEDSVALANAAAAGKLHEDPQRRALRQALIYASGRVESSPCDNQLRQGLKDAVAAYLSYLRQTHDDPVETFTLEDGTVIDATGYLSQPARDAMHRAQAARCDGGSSG
jgi:hypothetical protein